jgi:hypothetical protein
MSNLASTADRLRSKIEKLLHLHSKLEADNLKLARERETLRKTIELHEQTIQQLKEENKLVRIGQQLPADNGNNDLKLKINELVREIDKCIALLNR